MNGIVVTLYVEGGERDGDTLACGPFSLLKGPEEAANLEAENIGQVQMIELSKTSADILKELEGTGAGA